MTRHHGASLARLKADQRNGNGDTQHIGKAGPTLPKRGLD